MTDSYGTVITRSVTTEHVLPVEKDFTTQRAFIIHAASLHQGFPHCARFSTAASRRSLGRISIPVWGAMLSHPLPIIALVSRYLAN